MSTNRSYYNRYSGRSFHGMPGTSLQRSPNDGPVQVLCI